MGCILRQYVQPLMILLSLLAKYQELELILQVQHQDGSWEEGEWQDSCG